MQDYSFFKTLVVTDTNRQRQPKTNVPESGLTLRVLKDGRVYPSKELADRFDLEYKHAAEANQGNGIDVVDTKKWTILTNQPRAILFGITPKNEAKVDLFASWRCKEDGSPKGSVFLQGAPDKTLLALVKEFGWLTEEQTYVDLKVLTEYEFKTTDGIANIPKVVTRGEGKGNQTYVRRENVSFFPVVPTDLETIVTQVATTTEVEQTVTN